MDNITGDAQNINLYEFKIAKGRLQFWISQGNKELNCHVVGLNIWSSIIIFFFFFIIFFLWEGGAESGAGASGEGRVRINGLSKALINQVIL